MIWVEKNLLRKFGSGRMSKLLNLKIYLIIVFRKGFVIYDQLKKMGSSVDWDRAVFMMDPVNPQN